MSKRKRHVQKDNKLLSIVTPVFGRFDLLNMCIESLINSNTTFRYDVILVDNNSPDQEEARAFYAGLDDFNILVKRNRENIGFPKACNYGARRKTSPLILFLNSDIILDADCLELMVREMDNPNIGVVGARLLFPEDVGNLQQVIRPANKVQHIGLSCDARVRIKHPLSGWDKEHKKVMSVRQAFAVTGACMLTRRSLFSAVGGFDEQYGMGTYEDVDFCMAVRELGKEIIVQPRAWAYHYTGASAETYNQGFPLNGNEVLFKQKWAGKLFYSDYLYY